MKKEKRWALGPFVSLFPNSIQKQAWNCGNGGRVENRVRKWHKGKERKISVWTPGNQDLSCHSNKLVLSRILTLTSS